MAGRDLSYFMKGVTEEPESVEIRGLDRFKDEKGNVIPFTVRILGQDRVTEIFERYRKRKLVYKKNGKPEVVGGSAVFEDDSDTARAVRHLIVEALEYPNLRDEKLMESYGCVDITEMPNKVFRNFKEYNYVAQNVLALHGLNDEDVDEVKEAKN